jgi:hypothetical protein
MLLLLYADCDLGRYNPDLVLLLFAQRGMIILQVHLNLKRRLKTILMKNPRKQGKNRILLSFSHFFKFFVLRLLVRISFFASNVANRRQL